MLDVDALKGFFNRFSFILYACQLLFNIADIADSEKVTEYFALADHAFLHFQADVDRSRLKSF